MDPYISGFTLGKATTVGGLPYLLDLNIPPEEIERVNRELLYWRFYKGDHWDYKRPDGEPQNTLNYSGRFVDKGVAFLAGKGFTINVEKGAEEIVKRPLDEVWDDNQRELLFLEMAQAGGVSGNAWVKVVVQEYDPNEEPVLAELYPKGRIRLLLIPGHCCFPRWDPHDRDKMLEIKIIYPIEVVEGGRLVRRVFREDIDQFTIRQYLDGELVDERENDLGLIPVVRIKNLVVAGESLGKSDLHDIIPINRELNEKTTDVSDIINYHAAPITLIFGAKSNNLTKGANKVWGGLPKDAKVENLELKSDLASSMNYIDLIKKALFEVGNMPEDAFGNSETKISNTSGVALHIRNQPLMDVTNMKRRTYGEGIEQINRIIVRYLYLFGMNDFNREAFDSLTPRQKWVYTIDFPNPLPKDELIQMQLIAQKITLQLISRIDALKELGVRDPEGKLEEIKQEFLEWQNLMFEAAASYETNSNGNSKLRVKPATNVNVGGIVPKFEQANGEDV